MIVDDVEDHGDPVDMQDVDQNLKLVGGALKVFFPQGRLPLGGQKRVGVSEIASDLELRDAQTATPGKNSRRRYSRD